MNRQTDMHLTRKLVVAATTASLVFQPAARMMALPIADGPATAEAFKTDRHQIRDVLGRVEPIVGTTRMRVEILDSVFEMDMTRYLERVDIARFPEGSRAIAREGLNNMAAIVMPSSPEAFVARLPGNYFMNQSLDIEIVPAPLSKPGGDGAGVAAGNGSWIYLSQEGIVRVQPREWSNKFDIQAILEKEGVPSLEGAILEWVPASHGTADMVRIRAPTNGGEKTFGILFERWDGGQEGGEGFLREIRSVEAPAGKTGLKVTARHGRNGWRTYAVDISEELGHLGMDAFPPDTRVIPYATRGGYRYVVLAPGAPGIIKFGIDQTGSTQIFKGPVAPYCWAGSLPLRGRIWGDESYLIDSEENLLLGAGRQLIFMEFVSFNTSVFELDSLAGAVGTPDWRGVSMRLLPNDPEHKRMQAIVQIDLPAGAGMEHAYMPIYCWDCGQEK